MNKALVIGTNGRQVELPTVELAGVALTTSEVTAYAGTRTRLTTVLGYQYQLVTSSATADGVLILTAANTSQRWAIRGNGPLSVSLWGVTGDGVTDDTSAISTALNSSAPWITFPETSAYYKMAGTITVSNLAKKRISASGARIMNTTLTLGFLFQNSTNITLEGGDWGQLTMPTGNQTGSQHIMQFDKCQSVKLNECHLTQSPEMGVAFTNCLNTTVKDCLIENLYRDGIYHRYCAKSKITGNTLKNIKDDAISFHDKDNMNTANAGVDAEKTTTLINVYGYPQATSCLIANNIIENAYQGIVSVGGSGVKVNNNIISNIVLSGICLYNQNNVEAASLVNNCQVNNNELTNVCATAGTYGGVTYAGININGTVYSNNGQSGAGRSGIFIGSTGTNNQIGMGETKRVSNVQVSNNTVYSSGCMGFHGRLTDGLRLTNNTFINNNGANAVAQGVELGDVTLLHAVNNTVNDTRSTKIHAYGYAYNTVTGVSDTWNINGFTTGEFQFTAATLINQISKFNIPTKQPPIDSAGTVDWNTYKTSGSYQVAGASVGTAANNPFAYVTNAGTLTVVVSGDTLTQQYTDNTGILIYRHLNGLTGSAWSTWQLPMTGDTAMSSSRSIASGNVQTLNLRSGFYAVLPAVTGMPTVSANWTMKVTHHEDAAGPGGGTYRTYEATNLFDGSQVFSAVIGNANAFGGWFQLYVLGKNGFGTTKAGAPTTTDIPAGYFQVYKDSSGGSVKLYYNDGGTLKSVALT